MERGKRPRACSERREKGKKRRAHSRSDAGKKLSFITGKGGGKRHPATKKALLEGRRGETNTLSGKRAGSP